MFSPRKELILYERGVGKFPFKEWLEGLQDKKARYVIRARLDRLRYYGHAGNCKRIGKGVLELKIYYGPGYRVYFGEERKNIILLLCGGDKNTQKKDIQRAQSYLADYRGGR